MITVSSAVEAIIKKRPMLQPFVFNGLGNLAAIARSIKDEVESMTKKKVSEGAIIMALKRSKGKLDNPVEEYRVLKPLNIIVRSSLVELTFSNSETSLTCQKKLLDLVEAENDVFCNITRGMTETTIIASSTMYDDILDIFKNEKLLLKLKNLSSITINHPEEVVYVPRVYHTVLKLLAWEGINLIELASTYRELTLVFEDKEINTAFSTLNSYFNQMGKK